MSSTNYQALGELTAYTAQAQDAAQQLRSHLYHLLGQVQAAASFEPSGSNLAIIRYTVDDAERAQRELRAALQRANQAAALCGRPDVDPGALASRDTKSEVGS